MIDIINLQADLSRNQASVLYIVPVISKLLYVL